MKRIQALIAAAIITAIVGLGMLLIGVNALANTRTAPINNTLSNAAMVGETTAQTQTQLNQLQDVIAQYKNREAQYQSQLDQANRQLRQYQLLLNELQRRGMIRINSDGTIQLREPTD